MWQQQASLNGQIREIGREEGRQLLNRQTQRHLNMTAEDFIERWEAGQFRDESEYPEAVRLAAMIPLAM